MSRDGYAWWKRRMAYQYEIYDVLRIDHFRGFDSYYAVPYGEATARNGRWRQGPGRRCSRPWRRRWGPSPSLRRTWAT